MNLIINGVQVNWIKEGGQAGYIYNLSRKLVELGHIVHLISSENNDCDSIIKLRKYGVIVYTLPTKFNIYGWINYFFLSTAMSIKIIKENQIDLIHAHSIFPGISGVIASYLTKKPLITTFHGGNIPSIKWKIKKLIRKIVINRCVKIIILNKKQEKEFLSDWIDGEKLAIIQTGVDIDEFNISINKNNIKNSFGIKDTEKIILSLSILNKRKNIDLIIKSFSIMKKQIPCRLIIAGDGPEKENLERFAEKLNIHNDIIFTGLINSRENAVKLLKCADIFVLTSLEEGLPLTILEAMAAKVPVVSTKVGGVPNLIFDGKNGFLVSYEPTEIAKTIIKILSNEELIVKVAKEAYETVRQNYTWDKVAIENEKVYNLINEI